MTEEAGMAPAATLVDVAALIDQQKIGRFQIQVLLLCASAMFVDGFDTQAIGYVAPALSAALGLRPGALGLVFAAGGLGAILGGLVLAPYADRVGRKPIIIGSMLFFAVCTLLISLANTVPQLMWMRFAIGLGLGGVVPNALALTAECVPKKFRVTLVLMTWLGFSFGSALAGPITAHILDAHSWRCGFCLWRNSADRDRSTADLETAGIPAWPDPAWSGRTPNRRHAGPNESKADIS